MGDIHEIKLVGQPHLFLEFMKEYTSNEHLYQQLVNDPTLLRPFVKLFDDNEDQTDFKSEDLPSYADAKAYWAAQPTPVPPPSLHWRGDEAATFILAGGGPG